MKLLSKLHYISTNTRNKFLNFKKNSEGVAAVEFALIAPILVILFIGTIEVSLMIALDRKIARTSSAIADLIAQGGFSASNSENEIRAIFGITDRIMFPYTDKIPCVVISRVKAKFEDTNNDGVEDANDEVIARVTNSIDNSTPSGDDYTVPDAAQCNKTPAPGAVDPNARLERNTNSIFKLPDGLNINGSDLIIAEVEYDHTPTVGLIKPLGTSTNASGKSFFKLSDRIYLRPRTNIEGF